MLGQAVAAVQQKQQTATATGQTCWIYQAGENHQQQLLLLLLP